MWALVYTKAAQRDARKLARAGLRDKAEHLLKLIEQDPFASPPTFEKLVGNLAGAYSRRITRTHRLVYQLRPDQKVIVILSLWSHYRD